MNTKGFIFGVLTTILVIAIAGGAYYLGTQKKKTDLPVTNIPPVSETAVVPTLETIKPTEISKPEANIPAGWQTYTNQEYGFSVSYPPAYKALTDNDNLYGWPNAVALIYGGGQSYDLPVEIWDSVAQYEAKYGSTGNLTVHKVGTKFVTLVNMNMEPEVDDIIQTFALLD